MMLSYRTMFYPKRAMCFPHGYIDAKECYVLPTRLFWLKRGLCVAYRVCWCKRRFCATHIVMMAPKRSMRFLPGYIISKRAMWLHTITRGYRLRYAYWFATVWAYEGLRRLYVVFTYRAYGGLVRLMFDHYCFLDLLVSYEGVTSDCRVIIQIGFGK